MAEWMVGPQGDALIILDEFAFRDHAGAVTAWVCGNGVYNLGGEHIGWFEDGRFYDVRNRLTCMLAEAAEIDGDDDARNLPPMPEFFRRPPMPRLKARKRRSGAAGAGEGVATGHLHQPRGMTLPSRAYRKNDTLAGAV